MPIETRHLGVTGMSVSSQCLGTWMLGPSGIPDPRECEILLHRALDLGITTIETVDAYDRGQTETLVGNAIAHRWNELVVIASFGLPFGNASEDGCSRRSIVRACENSLRRLKVDAIDIYTMHRHDGVTDMDEVLGALSSLVHAGKVRTIATSTQPAEAIVEAQWVAERRGHVRFTSEQPLYSMLTRRHEADVLPLCERYGLGVISWAPLQGGWLTGKYRRGEDFPRGSRFARRRRFAMAAAAARDESFDRNAGTPDDPANAAKLDAVERLCALAADSGMSPVHLAMGFVGSHRAISSVMIGPRTLDQLTEYVAAPTSLPDDVLDEIDRIVPPGDSLEPLAADLRPRWLSDHSMRRRRSE